MSSSDKPHSTKWYIQFSMLFDNMDLDATETGIHCILTTENVDVVWERATIMKNEFKSEYMMCHGATSPRTFIATIKDNGKLEIRYDDDNWINDKSLRTIMNTDQYITTISYYTMLHPFRESESLDDIVMSLCENEYSQDDENPDPGGIP